MRRTQIQCTSGHLKVQILQTLLPQTLITEQTLAPDQDDFFWVPQRMTD